MILTRDVDLGGPLSAAPAAVVRAVADRLRSNGCVIRSTAPGVVEFYGPGMFSTGRTQRDRAASAVKSGYVWIDPASGHARMTLRIHSLHFLLAIVPAGVVMTMDLSMAGRLLILAVTTLILCVNLVMARSVFERWVTEGARRA